MTAPRGSSRPDGHGSAPSRPDSADVEPLRLHIIETSEMPGTRARIRTWLGATIAAAHVDDVLLACGEAMDNALEHGLPPIVVQLAWLPGSELCVEVHDAGPSMRDREAHDRGFGMPIMSSLMDAVSVDTSDGTTVTLRRRFEP